VTFLFPCVQVEARVPNCLGTLVLVAFEIRVAGSFVTRSSINIFGSSKLPFLIGAGKVSTTLLKALFNFNILHLIFYQCDGLVYSSSLLFHFVNRSRISTF
jgi:hypothetical protein